MFNLSASRQFQLQKGRQILCLCVIFVCCWCTFYFALRIYFNESNWTNQNLNWMIIFNLVFHWVNMKLFNSIKHFSLVMFFFLEFLFLHSSSLPFQHNNNNLYISCAHKLCCQFIDRAYNEVKYNVWNEIESNFLKVFFKWVKRWIELYWNISYNIFFSVWIQVEQNYESKTHSICFGYSQPLNKDKIII